MWYILYLAKSVEKESKQLMTYSLFEDIFFRTSISVKIDFNTSELVSSIIIGVNSFKAFLLILKKPFHIKCLTKKQRQNFNLLFSVFIQVFDLVNSSLRARSKLFNHFISVIKSSLYLLIVVVYFLLQIILKNFEIEFHK